MLISSSQHLLLLIHSPCKVDPTEDKDQDDERSQAKDQDLQAKHAHLLLGQGFCLLNTSLDRYHIADISHQSDIKKTLIAKIRFAAS